MRPPDSLACLGTSAAWRKIKFLAGVSMSSRRRMAMAYAWEVVLYAVLFCAIIATLLLALLWKLRPQA